jgi:hypothetical protein
MVMMHLYTNFRDGSDLVEDPNGADFTDLSVARHEATLAARELIAEHIRNGSTPGNGQYEITDEAGRVVAAMTFDEAIRAADR